MYTEILTYAAHTAKLEGLGQDLTNYTTYFVTRG